MGAHMPPHAFDAFIERTSAEQRDKIRPSFAKRPSWRVFDYVSSDRLEALLQVAHEQGYRIRSLESVLDRATGVREWTVVAERMRKTRASLPPKRRVLTETVIGYKPIDWTEEIAMSQTSGTFPALNDNVKKTIATKPPRKPKR